LIARDAARIIHETINGVGLPAPFKNLLLVPLSRPGKILYDEDSAGWSSLISATSASVRAPELASARVLAAVEVNAAALDVLDEIEDGDASPLVDQVGLAQALNVATALLFIAPLVLEKIGRVHPLGADPADYCATLARLGLTATLGQHHDLTTATNHESSLEEALMITRAKSGSLAACAVRLTALLGTNNSVILELYEDFGRHYGTMVQLANDLHDAQSTGDKSDLTLRKPTLPVIFFLRGSDKAPLVELTPEAVAKSGALQFTWVVFERERQACHEVLDRLDGHNQDTTALRGLVD
jgi:geranylgeranyl pyrophosphate synthase